VRNGFLHPLGYMHEISGASVKIDGGWFPGSDVKKFSIAPRDGGQVDITCSVAIYPSSNEVAELAKNVQDGARVEIEGPPDLFDGDQGAAAAGNAATDLPRKDGAPATVDATDDGPDPMLAAARDVVLKQKRASISLVQRELRLGYNRAARLPEALESEGTVSAMNETGARKILKGTP
jgi:DNA segregation ATPase FtsK/SpoIIIE-like protein